MARHATTIAPPDALPRLLPSTETEPTLAHHEAAFGKMPTHIDIADLERSGLRGRGGASFPSAVKMHAVAAARGRTIVVANGSEGEPASLKDRTLMQTTPHLILDGAVLAARAVHAKEAIVCVTRGNAGAIAAMVRAIGERTHRENDGVRISLEHAPHRYVAGEESALVHWLNGGPAKPTFTPPRPYQRGVGGVPTLVHNVETLANIALIARFGPGWFRSIGDRHEPGSRLVTVSGAVTYPGVLEIPTGIPLGRLMDATAGARNTIGAFLVGGYFGSWVSAERAWEMPLTDVALREKGGAMGAGVIVALSNTACGVGEVARVARYLSDENAGQCGPCLHGLPAIANALTTLAECRSQQGVLDRVARWSEQVQGRGACRHPDGALRFIRSGVEVFAADFARHSRGEPCTTSTDPGVCPIPQNAHEPWR